MNKLEPYIKALAQKIGIPLEVPPGGSFTALLGKHRLLVQVLENSNSMLFYIEVGRPTLFRRNEVLASLMGGNLFLAETRGAALSYDPSTENVGLNLILSLNQLESDEFINAVDNIMLAAESWAKQLDALNAEAEDRSRRDTTADVAATSEDDTALMNMAQMIRV